MLQATSLLAGGRQEDQLEKEGGDEIEADISLEDIKDPTAITAED